ncbi:cache domain-containing protein [Hydrogenimonas sp.]
MRTGPKLGIETVNLLGIGGLLLFALMFTALVVFEEYRDFEAEVAHLKSRYLAQKKEEIARETERVLRFIAYEYGRWPDSDDGRLKRQILEAIEQLYTDLGANRYIFVYRLDGTNVLDPNHPELKGRDMMAVTDPTGFPILPNLIRKAKDGGGFVSYIWEEPATGRFSPKLSYARIFEPWGWLVGTGVYMGELDAMVADKQAQMRSRLIKYVTEILTLSAILFGLALAGIRLINHTIREEIATFSRFFKEAATRHSLIDPNRIRLKEFLPLARYVNQMARAIQKRERALTELNRSLEEKVRHKTAKLRRQKEYSDKLVKAQDAFIKTSIHELNTPLAVIMAQIDLLKMKGHGNRYVRKIEAAAKRVLTLYGDLSYLLRRDRVRLAKEPVEPLPFLQERLDFFEEIALANGVAFWLDARPCPPLCIHPEELGRLVDNNLSNAIKYATPGSTVRVRLACDEGATTLSFTNEAAEIERIEKLFEPFYKENEEAEGFGLGLALVKEICEKHGIGVSLKHEGNLVTFSYQFDNRGCDEDPAA